MTSYIFMCLPLGFLTRSVGLAYTETETGEGSLVDRFVLIARRTAIASCCQYGVPYTIECKEDELTLLVRLS